MVARSVVLGLDTGLSLRAAAAAPVQLQQALAGRLEETEAVTTTTTLVMMWIITPMSLSAFGNANTMDDSMLKKLPDTLNSSISKRPSWRKPTMSSTRTFQPSIACNLSSSPYR